MGRPLGCRPFCRATSGPVHLGLRAITLFQVGNLQAYAFFFGAGVIGLIYILLA
jgi:hypothetical protein